MRRSEVTFFDPKYGVLVGGGAVGNERRGWVRELRFSRDTAVPYDSKKLAKIFKKTRDLSSRKEYNFHVDLTPVKLPNLHHLKLAEPSYLLRGWPNNDEPSYLDLVDKLGLTEIDWSDNDEEVWEREEELGWLWIQVMARNDEIIRGLLASFCGANQLRTLEIPFGVAGGEWYWGKWDEKAIPDPRIPSSIRDQEGQLRVVTVADRHGSVATDVHLLDTVAAQIPLGVEVRISMGGEYERKQLLGSIRKAGKEKQKEWAKWSFVEKDGSLTPLIRPDST